jgi:hypothetical protein
MSRSRVFAIAAFALLGSCLLAGVALGEKVTAVPTSVTFSNPESGVYEGEVRSNRGVCRKGRRVSVIQDRNHNGRSDHSDPTLAKTFSGNNGAYRAKGGQAARGGRLLVVVGAKILSRNAFCRPVIKNAAALSG